MVQILSVQGMAVGWTLLFFIRTLFNNPRCPAVAIDERYQFEAIMPLKKITDSKFFRSKDEGILFRSKTNGLKIAKESFDGGCNKCKGSAQVN